MTVAFVTFEDFEKAVGIDAKMFDNAFLNEATDILCPESNPNNIQGYFIKMNVPKATLQEELNYIGKSLSSYTDHLIVYQKLKDNKGIIKRENGEYLQNSHYLFIVFNTISYLEVKKLLKAHKLKAFT